MARKPAAKTIVTDNEEIQVRIIDSGVDETEKKANEDGDVQVQVGVGHVEKIKAIVQCEESIAFYRETISAMKKSLVEDLGVDAGFVSELIGIVKREMDPEGGGVIIKKNKVLEAAEQAVVLYPNVQVRASTLGGLQAADAEENDKKD